MVWFSLQWDCRITCIFAPSKDTDRILTKKDTDMKKFSSYISLMVMALLPFSFTSCDDDALIADTLWGEWQGEMYVSSYWNGRYYDASYSELAFDKDPCRYASGTGYWIDYYSNAPWDYHANHIRWTVSNSIIRIHFVEDGGTLDIYDYSLSGNYFSGVIYNDRDEELHFRLRKTSYPTTNWDDFRWGWYSDWDYNTRMNTTENDTLTSTPIRIIGRSTE